LRVQAGQWTSALALLSNFVSSDCQAIGLSAPLKGW